MIDESAYWRRDLQRFAASIERSRSMPVITDAGVARLERDHMYGFFVVRRLMECFKLSDDTLALRVPLKQHLARTGASITALNWTNLERHYEIERPRKAELALRDLANQAIHSYVFSLVFCSRAHCIGVFLSSEYRRRKSIVFVPTWRTVRLFRRIARDWPDIGTLTFDPALGDYRFSGRRSLQPTSSLTAVAAGRRR